MKKYHLGHPDNFTDYWEALFEVLSVSQFESFQKICGFDRPVTDELRTLMREVVATYMIEIIGEYSPLHLTTQLISNNDDPIISLWDNTFLELETIGYADSVYEWGKRTYEFLDRHPLIDLSSDSYTVDLLKLAYSQQGEIFRGIRIDKGILAKLRNIEIGFRAFHYHYRHLFATMLVGKTLDYWDVFAFKRLRTKSWMGNQVQVAHQLHMWEQFLDIFRERTMQMDVATLTDEVILLLAQSQMPTEQSERLSHLLNLQQAVQLTEDQAVELEMLLQLYDEGSFQKIQALVESVRRGLMPPIDQTSG